MRKAKRTIPELPEELQQKMRPLVLTQESTPAEKLAAIEHFIPTTTNLIENLTILRHLGFNDDDDIATFLTGGSRSIYGEIVSMRHPSVKVTTSYSSVSITNGKVYIDKLPFENYIKAERKRQEDLIRETEELSKEDMMAEIRKLRKDVKHISNRLKDVEQLNDSLRRLNELYAERIQE